MTNADLQKIQSEDFTLSLRMGPPRLEVTDQEKIPSEFFLPQPPKLDRLNLISGGQGGPGGVRRYRQRADRSNRDAAIGSVKR
jgi:hypothetical protein